MNNEEKILEILVQMQSDIAGLKVGQAKLEVGQEKLEAGQSELRAEMNERFDSVNERLDSVELSIKEAWKDLDHIEDRVDLHDVTIKKIM